MKTTLRILALTILVGASSSFSKLTKVEGQAVAGADELGFEAIFDGKTLQGWDGDARVWRVENGAIVGEVSPELNLKTNSFLIWRGGNPGDFELKAEYRISSKGNSGIQYRSIELPDIRYAMKGYQADIDGEDRNEKGVRYTGQNYEERGRGFLAWRGQLAHIDTGKKPVVLGSVGGNKELEEYIKNGDWNEFHLIVRGTTLIHILNGHVMCVFVDDDTVNRKLAGLLGIQVHVGPPMKIEFRNVRLKKL
jgi:Domain of Unknown Function (DUF1080)